MCSSLEKSGEVEGVKYDVAINGYLAAFREEETGAQQRSELAEKVIRLLPQHTAVLPEKPAYHWQHFKVAESAVPFGLSGQNCHVAWHKDTR